MTDYRQLGLWAAMLAGFATIVILWQHGMHSGAILRTIGLGSRDQSGAVPTAAPAAAIYPQLSPGQNNPPYQARRMGFASAQPALGANVVSISAMAPNSLTGGGLSNG